VASDFVVCPGQPYSQPVAVVLCANAVRKLVFAAADTDHLCCFCCCELEVWYLCFSLMFVDGAHADFVHGQRQRHTLQRLVTACALAFGLGVSFVPQWAENNLWPEPVNASSALLGIRLAVLLILETGFYIGALVAFLLNLIIPDEQPAAAADLPVAVSSERTSCNRKLCMHQFYRN